jgi:hypothetical protein
MSALDELIARDSAPSGGSALDALIARDNGPGPALQAASISPPADTTPWDSLTRQLGLTARAGVNGVAGLPMMVGNAMNGAINLGVHGVNSAAGTHIPSLQMPSDVVDHAMNSAGIPQAQNDAERLSQAGASGMAGVTPFSAIGKVLSKAAGPVSQAIGNGLQALPGMQMIGGAASGMSGEAGRQNGVGPLGQIGLGILGGVGGAVAPSIALAGARAVSGTANNIAGAIRPILNPQKAVGTGLADAIGVNDAADVAARIRGAQQYVPGSMPTTAQAGGGAALVATEKAAANSDPAFQTAFAGREANNNAARWDALNSVARSPEDLANAIADRSAVAGPKYDTAHAQMVPINEGLTALAARPAVKQAMASADLLAKNSGTPIQWPTPDNPVISGRALDYTSRALGDLIGSARSAGRSEEVRALTGAQIQLKDWMTQHVPGVREAAADYQAFSSPVNTMQAGQQIAGKLQTGRVDTNQVPMLQLSPYKSALTQAIKAQEFGIDEGAHRTLQGIGQDLQRATTSNSLKSPGSDSAYNIAASGWLARQIYGQNFSGATGLGKVIGLLGATALGHPLVGLGLLSQANKLGLIAGNKMSDSLRGLLLNPESLLPYLDSIKSKQMPKSLLQGFRGDISQGLLGAASAERASP